MNILLNQNIVYSLQEATRIVKNKILEAQKRRYLDSKVLRLELKVEPLNHLAWLNSQTDPTKIFWVDRDNQLTLAGLGRAHQVSGFSKSDPSFLNDGSFYFSEDCPFLRYYGGICFDPYNTPTRDWSNFGLFRFILPQFELISQNGENHFVCNIYLGENPKESCEKVLIKLEKLTGQIKNLPVHLPEIKNRKDQPIKREWNKILKKLKFQFEKHSLEKIVLARQTVLNFERMVNPYSVLTHLKRTNNHSFLFSFQFSEQENFLGVSPERLYKRQGRIIETEALAGTRPRLDKESQDLKMIEELKNSKKDLLEHQIVVDTIKKNLMALCLNLDFDPQPRVLSLTSSHHLISNAQGHLRRNVNDQKILITLHPTPAVCGSPTEIALRQIRNLEPFSRGWYAGPVGYLGYDHAEFIVAIRSGLLRGKSLSLYSGAGIVEGSTPQLEWQEIEHKLESFLKIFSHEIYPNSKY